MTPSTAVARATWRQLWRETSKVVPGAMEARWLLEEASGLDRSGLLRELDLEAPESAAARLESLVRRREAGEPLQHVLGHWSFRTLDVAVDARVLVPRPETEHVVSVALSELDRRKGGPARSEALVADLGTGSGVIALSLANERAGLRVIATDADPAALEVAARNRCALAATVAERVEFCHGEWYQALPVDLLGCFDLIVSNPPYVAENEWADLEATVRDFDPYGALVSGPSGLEAIEAVVTGAPAWLAPKGALVVEIAPHQAEAAHLLSVGAGFENSWVEDDLAKRPRVLVARR